MPFFSLVVRYLLHFLLHCTTLYYILLLVFLFFPVRALCFTAQTLLVLDGTTGQNALSQAKQFMEVADISGIILTKMDGTAKGGIAVAIQSELGIPVKYIGVGERIDDLQKFNSEQFVTALFDRKDTSSEQ